MYGNNCNGIISKMDSFNKILCDLQPSVFSLQEIKRKISDPPIKSCNLENYQIFELKREIEKDQGGKGLAGGGLAIGAVHKLSPVLTRQGNDEVECVSVEIKAGDKEFLIVTGYGPQKIDGPVRKAKFWKYLDEEVKTAEKRKVGLIIQIDSNAWVGKEVIPNDPNETNSNGKLMKKFLENNPDLTVVNALKCCEGTITRERTTILGQEKSAIDVFIVCKKVLPLIKHMEVNHDGKYKLTNFKAKKFKGKVTETDHNPVILVLDLLVPPIKPEKVCFRNMKDSEGQMKFFNMTSQAPKLRQSFTTTKTFEHEVALWQKEVKSCIYRSFPKIRQKKRKFKEDEIGYLIEKRKQIKLDPETAETQKKLDEIEDKIVEKTESKYAEKVKEAIGDITGEDGKYNEHGVWKTIRKIFPKNIKQKPMALKDKTGNLITGYEAIKKYSLESMVKRLRKRPIHPNMKKLEKLKTKLTKKRLRLARLRKSPKWSLKIMEKAIQSMKTNKCRDPEGLISEILKPGVAGEDFKMSLLSLMNKTKELLEIPSMMKNVNIALIPKTGKKKLQNIENHRGIFLIHKYRSLIMRMILNDKYEIIDKFMSDSNVGGRKERGIRDHLFVVNGIIHEHKNSNKSLAAQILDYKSCFDSMWLDEVTNDLYEAGVNDDKLVVLYKLNETNEVAVKTPVGLSKRQQIRKIICQGDPWGPIECSLMVDNFGKESLKPELEPYKYKDKVEIPALGMIDDILLISETGHKTLRMNAFINVKTATKRLQFGPEKCHVMYIGKNIPKHKKPDLFVDGWKLEEIENKITGETEVNEEFEGEQPIEEKESEKYLGQILSKDGSNTKNIENRANKGIGITNKIENILENNPGGKYHFEIAVLIRNACLISSLISSSETWYDLKESELRKLEKCDENLLRKILKCSNQVPHEILYLELGLIPIRYIIILRRTAYLQEVLKQSNKKSVIFRFFMAQLENPTKNDWVTQVLKDLTYLDINLDLEQIEAMTADKFKALCKTKVKFKAFEYLEENKMELKSVKHIRYDRLEMAKYLRENNWGFTNRERQYLFQCRLNDIDVRANRKWKYKEIHCISCNDKSMEETTEHILNCATLISRNYQYTYIPSFNELYSSEVEDQIYVSRTIFKHMQIRDKIANRPS